MKTSEEIIQKQTEEGNAPANIDGEAYKLVFEALCKEPAFKLPSDFAKKVSLMASEKKSFNWDKFFFICGGIGFVAALIYAFASIQASFSVGVFQFFSSYSGLALFGVVFVLLLNWVDKKIINKPSHKAL